MKRQAFLLGLFSVGGQVLILRELISSFNGDELFIGTALFGWLLSVAIGALLGGGLLLRAKVRFLFMAGGVLLPVMIIAARLCPMPVTLSSGEIVPFVYAALFSIFLMMPIGFISGWLFPVISRKEHRPAASIVMVYLFEGFGAFVGGLIIALLVGRIYSTLAMSFLLAFVVILGYRKPGSNLMLFIRLALLVFYFLILWKGIPKIDEMLEGLKYDGFETETVFDTPYGHQAILSRDSLIILKSDNNTEAVWPDLETAENILIPPLLYLPEMDEINILYLGRAEFGITQLADSLKNVNINMLDPRAGLSWKIKDIIPDGVVKNSIEADPISYFSKSRIQAKYDIIIINVGPPDNYKNSRLLSLHFLLLTQKLLKPGGILFIPTEYDSDRYITSEVATILSVTRNTLSDALYLTHFWPGVKTAIFASDSSVFNMSLDSLTAGINRLNYSPRYISEYFLADRLEKIKTERLSDALSESDKENIIEFPILTYLQSIYRSKAAGVDQKIVPYILNKPYWLLILPVFIISFYVVQIVNKSRRRRYGLFLYFTAGLVSLSAELITFYLYQSLSGSLYIEMAALIGSFMLGLALGVYYSCRINKENLEFPSLLLLLTSQLILLATYDKIGYQSQLVYYTFFLFTTALATGSLFVAASDRYYYGQSDKNRGLGYAVELIGSAIGALLTTTILLPVIGLFWLLILIILLIIFALAGSVLTAK
jgi:spermidine synthase